MTTERLPRVLVGDDELTMREFLEMGLGYEGFDVRTAADGSVGLETARAWAPDLVILDRMLPGLDGLEICRRLRAAGDVGVLMLSARGEVDDRIEERSPNGCGPILSNVPASDCMPRDRSPWRPSRPPRPPERRGRLRLRRERPTAVDPRSVPATRSSSRGRAVPRRAKSRESIRRAGAGSASRTTRAIGSSRRPDG